MRADAIVEAPSLILSPSASARRRLPAWLATLALAWHLLVPGLCLAQMLAAGPLGAICSAADGGALQGAGSQPDAAAAGHAVDGCSHCLATSAALADMAPQRAAQAPPSARPEWQATPARSMPRGAWRPPPRGPPLSA